MLALCMYLVKAQFILYVQKQEEGTSKPQGEPRKIDKGMELMIQQVSKRNFKIIEPHKVEVL